MPQLTISDPAISPATTEPSVYLARLVTLPDGRPALAVVEVPMAALTAIISQAGSSQALAITLERDDGQVLASVPCGAGLRALAQRAAAVRRGRCAAARCWRRRG